MNKNNRFKVLHLSYSCDIGGAARASQRIHKSLIKNKVNSKMLIVKSKIKSLNKNYFFPESFFDRDRLGIKKIFLGILQIFIGTRSQKVSLNIFPSNLSKQINSSSFDIINIHWIGNETLSLDDLKKIKKPIIWTMHDMNPFRNLEHYDQKVKKTFIYNRISKINFLRKKKLYSKIFHFVSVSEWLKNKAIKSQLLKNKKIYLIGNTIDTSFWAYRNSSVLKKKLKISPDKFIIGFGGLFDTRLNIIKGSDFLQKILYSKNLLLNKKKILFVFFGYGKFKKYSINGFDIINFGKLNTDVEILNYYSLLNIFLNLSRREAFGQTVLEAQSCSVPCLAFKNTGTSDIIVHKKTGWLLDSYSINKIEKIIHFAFIRRKQIKYMGKLARQNVKKKFDYKIISKKYLKTYLNILKNNNIY
jgi:glycosyltransferase involved in cell wall biosynthesis